MLEYETRQEELRMLKEAKDYQLWMKQRRMEDETAMKRRKVCCL